MDTFHAKEKRIRQKDLVFECARTPMSIEKLKGNISLHVLQRLSELIINYWLK